MVRPIEDVAADLGLSAQRLHPLGRNKAKVEPDLDRPAAGKLILVSSITPTPYGEGKTTTAIGLADGMRRLGQSVCLALREPSMGPCFGTKGGGTGTGRASLHPAQEINLHFTGDMHAIGAAHNLLAAMLDNALHFDRGGQLDPRSVTWP